MIFKQLLEGIDGGKILDVGCGSGQFTEILVDSLASFESITGVDVDEDVIKKARVKFPGSKFSFMNASSLELPFSEASFDLAAISKSLHHVEDPRKTLGEMCRVLKPGGYLLINEMNRDVLSDEQESHLIYHHLRSEIDSALGISHNHTFKRDDLIGLASGLGLKDMQTWEFIPDTDPRPAKENLRDFSDRMEGWMEELIDHPRRNEFADKVTEVRERIRRFGIARPPHMVFFGKK